MNFLDSSTYALMTGVTFGSFVILAQSQEKDADKIGRSRAITAPGDGIVIVEVLMNIASWALIALFVVVIVYKIWKRYKRAKASASKRRLLGAESAESGAGEGSLFTRM